MKNLQIIIILMLNSLLLFSDNQRVSPVVLEIKSSSCTNDLNLILKEDYNRDGIFENYTKIDNDNKLFISKDENIWTPLEFVELPNLKNIPNIKFILNSNSLPLLNNYLLICMDSINKFEYFNIILNPSSISIEINHNPASNQYSEISNNKEYQSIASDMRFITAQTNNVTFDKENYTKDNIDYFKVNAYNKSTKEKQFTILYNGKQNFTKKTYILYR